jgi:hypothetical protein
MIRALADKPRGQKGSGGHGLANKDETEKVATMIRAPVGVFSIAISFSPKQVQWPSQFSGRPEL